MTKESSAQPPAFDLASVDRLLTTTRSVRKRLDLDTPVPRGLVIECLELALQSPQKGNIQPWRWLLIDDPAVRTQVAELYRSAYLPYVAAQRAEHGTALDDTARRVLSSSDHLAEVLDRVPVLVIACRFGRPPLDDGAQGIATFYGSILPAVWSLMLALRSRGLGSAFTTLHLEKEQETAQLLGIPDSVTQAALLPIAYTIGGDFRPAARRSARAVTYLNHWGEKLP